MKRTSYEAPQYAVFSNLLLLPPSQIQIFSSAPSQEPSLCVHSLVWKTKFHTHTKQEVKLWFLSSVFILISWFHFPLELISRTFLHGYHPSTISIVSHRLRKFNLILNEEATQYIGLTRDTNIAAKITNKQTNKQTNKHMFFLEECWVRALAFFQSHWNYSDCQCLGVLHFLSPSASAPLLT